MELVNKVKGVFKLLERWYGASLLPGFISSIKKLEEVFIFMELSRNMRVSIKSTIFMHRSS